MRTFFKLNNSLGQIVIQSKKSAQVQLLISHANNKYWVIVLEKNHCLDNAYREVKLNIYILSKVITKGIENCTFKCKENQSLPAGV